MAFEEKALLISQIAYKYFLTLTIEEWIDVFPSPFINTSLLIR